MRYANLKNCIVFFAFLCFLNLIVKSAKCLFFAISPADQIACTFDVADKQSLIQCTTIQDSQLLQQCQKRTPQPSMIAPPPQCSSLNIYIRIHVRHDGSGRAARAACCARHSNTNRENVLMYIVGAINLLKYGKFFCFWPSLIALKFDCCIA